MNPLAAARDRLLRFPELCGNGHGGHQYDSRFCRICGIPLTGGKNRMAKPDDTGKPDVSWTDNIVWGQKVGDLSDHQLRRAARAAGVNDQGTNEELADRLKDLPEPTGWKWEG